MVFREPGCDPQEGIGLALYSTGTGYIFFRVWLIRIEISITIMIAMKNFKSKSAENFSIKV